MLRESLFSFSLSLLKQATGSSELGQVICSVKDDSMLWVQVRDDIRATDACGWDRKKLAKAYTLKAPADSAQRDSQIADHVSQAVVGDVPADTGVHALLHELLDATHIAQISSATVNGLACALAGKEACGRLFTESLWSEQADSHIECCLRLRDILQSWRKEKTQQPQMIVLPHQGMLLTGQSEQDVRDVLQSTLDTLTDAYIREGVSTRKSSAPQPDTVTTDDLNLQLRQCFSPDQFRAWCIDGAFTPAVGPVTDYHTAAHGAYPYQGPLTPDGMEAYLNERGHLPRILVAGKFIIATGAEETDAVRAMELARDSALIVQLTQAFGGPRYQDQADHPAIAEEDLPAPSAG